MIKLFLLYKTYQYFELVFFYEMVIFAKEVELPISIKEKTVDTRIADTMVKLSTPVSILIVLIVAIYMYLTQNI